MCGRFTLTSPLEALRELFGFDEQPNLQPRVNIAPTQDVVAVVRRDGDETGGETGGDAAYRLETLRWGLVPFWAKEAAIGAKMINARAETVAEKPAFREAFAKRRCLIPADGFYEWKAMAGGKQPFRVIRPDGAPFAFAGLWERWRDTQSGEELKTCTILTTDAAPAIREIHHRMPVIFTDRAQFDAWTAPEAARGELQELLRPLGGVEAYPVSKAVNKVANDDLSLLDPIALEAEEGTEEEEEKGGGAANTRGEKKSAQGSLF